MFAPVSPSDPGPKLWLPGRYAGARVEAVLAVQDSQARPEHYILDAPDTIIIVATGPDKYSRPPLDEVRAIAQERLQEFRQGDRALSTVDRRAAFNKALLDKLEREVQQAKHPGHTQFATG